ncbi:hypothetical protein D3C72_1259670 [compost metagenome]
MVALAGNLAGKLARAGVAEGLDVQQDHAVVASRVHPVRTAAAQHAGIRVDPVGGLFGAAAGQGLGDIRQAAHTLGLAQGGFALFVRDDDSALAFLIPFSPPLLARKTAFAGVLCVEHGLGRPIRRVSRQHRIALVELGRLQNGAVRKLAFQLAGALLLGRPGRIQVQRVKRGRRPRNVIQARLADARPTVICLNVLPVDRARRVDQGDGFGDRVHCCSPSR